jgi:hypothetical protein
MSGFSRRIAVVLGALLLAAGLPAVTAAAGPQWAWVVVREAVPDPGPTYTPASEDQGNSTGGVNTVTHTTAGPGRYLISFPGLGAPVGIAHVSMLQTRSRTCSIESPFLDGTFVRVFVNCFDVTPAANPADATFVVSYLSAGDQPVGSRRMAYLYWDDARGALVSYNSAGRSNSVQRVDFGDFLVTLRGMAGGQGHLQVSPWNRGVVCSVVSWRDSGSNRIVRVRCLSIAGVGQDGNFQLTYMRGMGLKGLGGEHVAYLLADEPTTRAYTPRLDAAYSSAGRRAHIVRSGTGRYQVTLPGMGRGGAAQVTAFRTQHKRCVIRGIERDELPQVVGVSCMSLTGTPADSKFYLTYLR